MAISHQALIKSISAQYIIGKLASCRFTGDVFLVGGAIRELALDRVPGDYDLALSDPGDLGPIEDLFGRRSFLLGKKPVQTHRIAAAETIFDITILDGTIEKDLPRRDFTMNAVAYDIRRGAIVDPLRGLEDIGLKLIRYPNRDTIASDPLRMLKAVRHFAALEGFTLDPELTEAIAGSGELIKQTAPERIKYELDLIMTSGGVSEGMDVLLKTGLLFRIFPELYALRNLDLEKGFSLETLGHTMLGFSFLDHYGKRYLQGKKAVKKVGYALLFHDLGKAHTYSYDEGKGLVHFFNHERVSKQTAADIMERLRFSTHEIRDITSLIENHMRIFLISTGDATDKAIRRLVYKMGDLTGALIVLTLCDMYGSSGGQDNPSTYQTLKNCGAIMAAYHGSKIEPLPKLLSGNDILSMGFTQGPVVGRCLGEVRDRQISGEITDRDEALRFAEKFLEEQGNR